MLPLAVYRETLALDIFGSSSYLILPGWPERLPLVAPEHRGGLLNSFGAQERVLPFREAGWVPGLEARKGLASRLESGKRMKKVQAEVTQISIKYPDFKTVVSVLKGRLGRWVPPRPFLGERRWAPHPRVLPPVMQVVSETPRVRDWRLEP